MLRDGAKEASRHAYRDAHGNLKGYVFRIERADGSKMTPPLAYCRNERGFSCWKWQAFEKENKTLYGLEKLARDPLKPILAVEGEKTADAAQKLFPDHHVVTWSGGAGNVDKTDWEPLAGKTVVVWPDNDAQGHKAAEALKRIVDRLSAQKGHTEGKKGSVAIVDLSAADLPPKWDLADAPPQGWTLEKIRRNGRRTLC